MELLSEFFWIKVSFGIICGWLTQDYWDRICGMGPADRLGLNAVEDSQFCLRLSFQPAS